MASKRKRSKSQQTKSKVTTAKRAKNKPRAKPSRKPSPAKRVVKKKKAKNTRSKSGAARKRRTLASGAGSLEPSFGRTGAVPVRQSGDFEGASRSEQADSESVDELAEEGNLFEAGAVAGVEEADNADEREVHTHEVPEDDVPEEYLDKD
jgi:hypothetical protein